MTDLVERLRYEANKARNNWPEVFCVSEDIAEEAADEIERLRKEIERLKDRNTELGWILSPDRMGQ